MPIRLASIIIMLSLSTTGMAAEYWKCIQKNGKALYTDMPCPGSSKRVDSPVKHEVRYVQNFAPPTSFLDDVKSFYHRIFPEQKTESQNQVNAGDAGQSSPQHPPASINQRCVNSKRTSHFDNLRSLPKTAYSSAEGC